MNIRHTSGGARRCVSTTLEAWMPILALIAICVALAFGGDAARDFCRYQRDAIEAGELWRLVTAHLVHLSWGHTAMNLAALVLIRLLVGDALAPLEWLGATLAAALAIDAGLYFIDVSLSWYVGLSGVLHGLAAVAAWVLLRAHPVLARVLAVGILAKLVFERLAGPLPLSESTSGGQVVVAAHLYGAAGGAAYGLVRRAVRRRRAAA